MVDLKFGMVLADTIRSKAYLNELLVAKIYPSFCLVMQNSLSGIAAGQVPSGFYEKLPKLSDLDRSLVGRWLDLDLDIPLPDILKRHGIRFTSVETKTINCDAVRDCLEARREKLFVFSGFGGNIISSSILSLDMKFLHIHGGYVPNFKGSTTNYYSLLAEGQLGASAIFLTKDLDSGPVLHREKFPRPDDPELIDYFIDPGLRARVLRDTLVKLDQMPSLFDTAVTVAGGETYFIIHPVLKHLAILGYEMQQQSG